MTILPHHLLDRNLIAAQKDAIALVIPYSVQYCILHRVLEQKLARDFFVLRTYNVIL